MSLLKFAGNASFDPTNFTFDLQSVWTAPQNTKVDGYKLGHWAHLRRQEYRNGKLLSERIEQLEALPGWVWDLAAADFDEGLDRLRKFVEKHGHATVPAAYLSEDNFKLGGWVLSRRQGYKKGKLLPERIEQLEELPGWVWDVNTVKYLSI